MMNIIGITVCRNCKKLSMRMFYRNDAYNPASMKRDVCISCFYSPVSMKSVVLGITFCRNCHKYTMDYRNIANGKLVNVIARQISIFYEHGLSSTDRCYHCAGSE